MGIAQIVQGKKYKKFMSYLYGWGAAVVILGALFKINHFEGANLMLILGMGAEALIFFFSAFEPVHEEVDWRKVYPELGEEGDIIPAQPAAGANRKQVVVAAADPLSAKLDQMFEQANISEEMFDKLGLGLKKLSDTASNIGNLSEIVGANNNYTSELQKTTDHLSKMNELYLTQLQVSAKQMEDTRKLQENMSSIMENLSGSLDDAKKYRTEVNDLSQKVAALSAMYGKMLSALSSSVK